uniref:Uncharacterized protein n=1 Tax=Caenorhabditis japonica TaxID=281687 RepID=A0A8R1E857_CAEJA
MGLRPIKLHKAHVLTDQLKRFKPADTLDILFTAENSFTIEQSFNRQYNSNWSPSVKEAIIPLLLMQDWYKTNLPFMITSTEWLPYLPDLIPMDFSVWSVLEHKAAIQKAWDALDVAYLSTTVSKRLRACVLEKGGLFKI